MEIDQPSIKGCYKIENNIVTDCEGNPADYNEISNVTEFLQRLRTGIMVGSVSLFARNKKEQMEKERKQDNEKAANSGGMGRDATTLKQEKLVLTESEVNDVNDNIRDNEFSLPNFNEELKSRENTKKQVSQKTNVPSHLTEREVEKLSKAGFINDENVGHEEAIFREMHPSHLIQPVFRKPTEYHDWDDVNSFEIPRYPVYAYGESSTPSGKEGELYGARTQAMVNKYWN